MASITYLSLTATETMGTSADSLSISFLICQTGITTPINIGKVSKDSAYEKFLV